MTLIELEVNEGQNSPMDLHRMYNLLQPPVEISGFSSDYLTDDKVDYLVSGWSEDDGACSAYAAKAEDSGEGVILLIYGGSAGIRIQTSDTPSTWDLNDSTQWGEPCLMLDPASTSIFPST